MTDKNDAIAALEDLRGRIDRGEVPSTAFAAAFILAVLGVIMKWIGDSEGRTSMGRLLFTQEIAADQLMDAIFMAMGGPDA